MEKTPKLGERVAHLYKVIIQISGKEQANIRISGRRNVGREISRLSPIEYPGEDDY